jgi:hypothetical protein
MRDGSFSKLSKEYYQKEMKEMNISKQNPKDRSKKKKFFEFLNLISELRDAELGILRFPPSEDSGGFESSMSTFSSDRFRRKTSW